MFTLKMRFLRHGGEEPGKPVELKEEYTEFVLADKVVAHDLIEGDKWEERMEAWEIGSYSNILSVTYFDNGNTGSVVYGSGRLLTVERDGKQTYYLVSHAWLLGPEGRTIERLV